MSGSSKVRRPATLASLAAELGVSRTTVSNAYNRPDQLSAPLRERVLEAARRLGYPGPDPVARSLRTRRAGAVGLLLTEALSYAFRDPVATGFLEGLALACERAGQGLLLIPVSPEHADVAAVSTASSSTRSAKTIRTSSPCSNDLCRRSSATSPRGSRAWTGSGSTTTPRCWASPVT
jgi:DNA-binding LacI/PurR family transcriptional regulator